MKDTLKSKLDSLTDRHEEVAALLGDADTLADQDKFRELSKEYAQLDEVVKTYTQWTAATEDRATAQEMLADSDPDVRELAADELNDAEERAGRLESELQILLLPRDPRDANNVYLEIRAGTGVMKRLFFQVTFSGCTVVMPRLTSGALRSFQSARASTVDSRKSSLA